jgi:hypothetical protein
MSKTLTLKYPTIISKKYLAQYQKYQDYVSAPLTPLIGCIYQGETTSKHEVIGMLMECGDVISLIKDKHGTSFNVLTNTLKSIQ